jgi:phosphatidylethanolamine/phosphatidyl-N-methylethanolamine N-methyltransferase
MSLHSSVRLEKKPPRFDDEVRFIRSWIEKPLSTGAVMPSGKMLARKMACYVDTNMTGPVVELGAGTGPVTEALIEHGVDPARLVLVEFNPSFCRVLRTKFPAATVVQGDAYGLRRTLGDVLPGPAAAVVSGLPLMTKPMMTRLRLLTDAFAVLGKNSPFIQFTYAVVPPIPTDYNGVVAEGSDLVWMNLPPARIWVYRRR